MTDETKDASEPPLDCIVGRGVTRWTGAVTQHERGGFVAYGDFMEMRAEVERLNAAILTAASILERDGDEHSVGYALRRALTPNIT